jgi:PKD repeat protein
MRFLLLFLAAFWPVFTPAAHAQRSFSPVADTTFLMERAAAWSVESKARQEAAFDRALRLGIPTLEAFHDGTVMELQYFSEDGLPVYYRTRNAGAAVTTGAASMHPGGSLRLFLTGKGYAAGVWDSGRIETSHDEFQGRVRMMDGSNTNSDHATHVTGTIVAAGIDPSARGMAFEGEVLGYDWNSDLGEMAGAAANGMIISNHSYGIVLGWSRNNGSWRWNAHVDSTRDYRFGFYTNTSRRLDDIAFGAPYYTIVWAAGNDRSDEGDGTRPPDGPYDTVGPEGVAKNVLAIGAVAKISGGYTGPGDVRVTGFSSWGPVDDGRVKPDLVGAGAGIYSTSLDNSYSSKNGTSMSSPNVTGSLLLLQQLYASQNDGRLMKAATLKSLAIHTVHQAGPTEGPDYRHGWGLLNVERAARMILHRDQTDVIISEKTLFDGETFEMTFQADGSGPVLATIAWTDPAGTPPEPAMNPRDLMLVNDLDMRLIDPEGQEHLPWQLDPEQPAAPPVQTDNFRDNVEKILVAEPLPGTYTLRITHKGSLENGRQEYSLCLQTRDIPGRDTYYWVGNSGLWSDAGNWSLSSGGEPVEGTPGPEDHVVFNRHSFDGGEENYLVELTEDAGCYSFTWETPDHEAVLGFNGHSLGVATSLFLADSTLAAGDGGTIVFTGSRKNNVVLLTEAFGGNITLRFDNEEGSWKALSDVQAEAIELAAGRVDLSGLEVRTKRITALEGGNKLLDLTGSEIRGLAQVDLDDVAMTLQAEEALFVFEALPEEGPALFDGGGHIYHRVENRAGELVLRDNNTFGHFANHAAVQVFDYQWFNHLELLPGSEMHIEGGTTQEIALSFDAVGTEEAFIRIHALGEGPAWLNSTNSWKACSDYLDIRDVSVTGTAIFSTGSNSLLEGASDGWYQQDCEDILFADFSAQYTCVNAVVFFHDQSTGDVTEWQWIFDRNDPELPGSTQQNPFYTYTEIGNVDVSLQVGDGVSTHLGFKTIYIQDNPMVSPNIHVQGNVYTSTFSAALYQWFLNGEPIPGATSRSYTNTGEVPGQYQVMISNRTCNRVSPALVVNVTEVVPDGGKSITVFPNPAREHIILDGSVPAGASIRLELVDLNGRVLFKDSFAGHELPQKRIGTASLLPGMYLLRIVVDGEPVTSRILIQ